MTVGTREWALFNENSIYNCYGDCRYCYAKGMAIRFKRATKENWHEERPRNRDLSKIHKVNGWIMFPTTHDLHYIHRDWWMPFLTELLAKGNNVLIVSKPEYESIKYICMNLYQFVNQIEFRFTIGSDDDEVRKFWEPGAPAFSERIDALKFAHGQGYKTSVSMEPLLTTYPEVLIRQIDPYVTGTIWIGIMNHMSAKDFDFDKGEKYWYNEMQELNSYENIYRIYQDLKNNPKIRWKDSVRELLRLEG